MERLWILLVLFMLLPLRGAELLKNNDWKQENNGLPLGYWRYQDYKSRKTEALSTFKFTPATNVVPGVVKITLLPHGKGVLICDNPVSFPAGSEVTLSGEYRTDDYVPGKNGLLAATVIYNYQSRDKAFPDCSQGIQLKPSEGKWTRFSSTGRIGAAVKGNFRAYFAIHGDSGSVSFRRLSLRVHDSSSRLKPAKTYVWREAEDLAISVPPTKWGNERGQNPGYFSGKGGVVVPGDFVWKFRIEPETDPKTLFNKSVSYNIWVRMYGYLGNPEVMVVLDGKRLSRFNTIANEQVDAHGKYKGPGFYYWQFAGTFKSSGGSHILRLKSKRMCLDALLISDDLNFKPEKFEARNTGENRFSDLRVTHEIRTEFRNFGVSDKVATPISFRINKPVKKISPDQPPAVFHISLPESIKVTEASSHRATIDWSEKVSWGGKKLSWKQSGTRILKGVPMIDYEFYLYYLCGNQYWLFIKADSRNFVPGKRYAVEYFLEDGSEKQVTETFYLTAVKVPEAKPFKKIYIGGGGAPFIGFWYAWKGIFNTMKYAGINAIECWGFENSPPRLKAEFLGKCRLENVRFYGQMSPFCSPFRMEDTERALGLDGKPFKSNDGYWTPRLSLDENSPVMRSMRDHLRRSAASGVSGLILDDEWSNQIFDRIDYAPDTKRLFAEYLEKHGCQYMEPELIVKNKDKQVELYRLWVDFKCERMAEFYRIFKTAYVSGLSDKSRAFFVTHIQGSKCTDPEQIKVSNFFDYRLLAKYCECINTMAYTYNYIRQSAQIGDFIEMYNRYIGRNVVSPTLLCDYEGHEIPLAQKPMLKYQLWEALMQQSRLIIYWMSYGMFNPLNLAWIAEGTRQLSPYEELLLNGKPYTAAVSSEKRIRIKGLKLDKKLLLYVANYQHALDLTARIDIGAKVNRITALLDGTTVKTENNGFIFNSAIERGQLFLITLE